MPVSTMLESANPVIRLTGEMDMPLCYALIDEMTLLHDYYQFRCVELQIDSPGGSADALQYLLLFLEDWRQGKVKILKTRALNQVCSAAALLLSLGTIGHRRAAPSSRLLYHRIRTEFAPGTMKTVAQLRLTSKQLEEWDAKFLDMLVEHVCSSPEGKAAHRRKLKRLLEKDSFISAQEALAYGLIDEVV